MQNIFNQIQCLWNTKLSSERQKDTKRDYRQTQNVNVENKKREGKKIEKIEIQNYWQKSYRFKRDLIPKIDVTLKRNFNRNNFVCLFWINFFLKDFYVFSRKVTRTKIIRATVYFLIKRFWLFWLDYRKIKMKLRVK